MSATDKQSFWTTFPGIITAIAALITSLAVAGFIGTKPSNTDPPEATATPRSFFQPHPVQEQQIQ